MYARTNSLVNATALQRLQRDHATIRATLQQLKSALNGGSPRFSGDEPQARQDARSLCAVLARQLRAHIRQEGRLAVRCSMVFGRMGPKELARLALEHDADQKSLRVVQLLAHAGNGWLAHGGPLLLSLIASLKRQMDAQEGDLFPFMERVLGVNGHSANGHSNGAAGVEGGNGVGRGVQEQLVAVEHQR